jgi:hypothetical protein
MKKHTGIVYTKNMDRQLEIYRKNNFMTALEMTKKIWISESAFYTIRRRKKISPRTLKKIQDNLWIDILN